MEARQSGKEKIDDKLTEEKINESEQNQLSTKTSETASKSVEVQQTYWSQGMNNRFNTEETRTNNVDNEIYYKLLMNNGSSTRTWLSSRYSSVYSTDDNAYWGLRIMYSGYVSNQHLFISRGVEYQDAIAIHPVIFLQYNTIDIENGYNNESGWSLK